MKSPWYVRVWSSWAARSLLVGACATAMDLVLGGLIIHLYPTESRLAAMSGTILGSTFTYFANRFFAFKDAAKSNRSVWRFVVTTVVLSAAHGQAMVWLRDEAGIPYALAKVMADVVVFTFTQLVLLRFFVFAKEKPAPPAQPDDQTKPS